MHKTPYRVSPTYALLVGAALAVPGTLALPGCGGLGGGGGKSSTAAGITSATHVGPRVDIASPTSGSTLAGTSVQVTGSITDAGRGVSRVAVNGQDVGTQAGPFQTAVALEPGVNTLVVEAWDSKGARTERHVSVLAGTLAPASAPIAAGAEVALTGAAGPLVSNFQTAATGNAGMPAVRTMLANSGNYTRRSSRTIRYIVIHTIEGSEAGAISWFQNPVSNVSAHYVVSHGGRVTRTVNDNDTAWHAGNRTYNEQSIGIENEGYAGRNNWTDVQYRTLAQLTSALCDRYAIPKDRAHIIAHREVPGATHTDPGPHFDWARFITLVRGSGGPQPRRTTQVVTTPGGQLLDVAWTPRPARTASGVTRVELDANVTARTPLPGRAGSSVVVRTPRAASPGPGSGAGNVGVAVHQDLLNRALHAAWRAGALDLSVDAADLAQLAPGSTAVLDRTALLALDPSLSSLLPEGTLEATLALGLPPTARVAAGGELALRAGAVDVRLDVRDAQGKVTAVGRFTAALRVVATPDGHGTTGRLSPGQDELHVDVAPGLSEPTEASLRRLAALVGPAVRDGLLGALEGVTLPTPGGIDLVRFTPGREGDTLKLTGTQR